MAREAGKKHRGFHIALCRAKEGSPAICWRLLPVSGEILIRIMRLITRDLNSVFSRTLFYFLWIAVKLRILLCRFLTVRFLLAEWIVLSFPFWVVQVLGKSLHKRVSIFTQCTLGYNVLKHTAVVLLWYLVMRWTSRAVHLITWWSRLVAYHGGERYVCLWAMQCRSELQITENVTNTATASAILRLVV